MHSRCRRRMPHALRTLLPLNRVPTPAPPCQVHDGTSLTGPSTLTRSNGRQFAVIACAHIAASCSSGAAACKLQVAAGVAEERAATLRNSLAAERPGSCVAVGVASNKHGLQWLVPPAQPGWAQALERAGGKGEGREAQQTGVWRWLAALATAVAAAASGLALGSR